MASTEWTKFKKSDFTGWTKIDAGSFATVYMDRSPTLGQVAIKVFHLNEEVPFDNREIDLLAQHSDHANIVHFHGLLVSDFSLSTCCGYVMEFMTMGCLDRVIHDAAEPYGRRQVILWMRQISQGLLHLHRKGIIHRDIKPKNLLLGKTVNDLKIADFGTARHVGPTTHTIESGTFLYMAPEVIQRVDGQDKYSFPADLYSLAITLWEISRREKPYSTLTVSTFDFLDMILKGKRPALDRSPISEEFDKLIQRGWSVTSSDRPSVSDFREFAIDASSNLADAAINVPTNPTVVQNLRIGASLANVPDRPQVLLLLGGHYKWTCYLNAKANKWKQLSLTLPYKDHCHVHAAAFLNEKLHIFAGQALNDLKFAYKLNKNLEWERLSDMNEARWNMYYSTVVFDGCIWVIGGNYLYGALKTVEAYDRKSNSWIEKPEMNIARYDAAAAVVKGKIFVCGGNNGKSYEATVEYFDALLSKWIFCTSMPAPRHLLSTVVYKGSLVVMGGSGPDADQYSEKNMAADVWRMDVDAPDAEWSVMPSMKIARFKFASSIIGEKIMVAGGYAYGKSQLKSVEIFDGNDWTEGPALPELEYNMTPVLVPEDWAKSLRAKYPFRR